MASLTGREIGGISVVVLVWSVVFVSVVFACERPAPPVQSQPEIFAPRQLVGDGLYGWRMGTRECYTTTASGSADLSCIYIPPTPVGQE